jgi:hypothetical protein
MLYFFLIVLVKRTMGFQESFYCFSQCVLSVRVATQAIEAPQGFRLSGDFCMGGI